MKLSKKTSKRQKAILERIRKGLPVAGLLTGLVALTGCDSSLQPVGTRPHVVGKYTSEPPPQRLAGDMPAPVPPPKPPVPGEPPVPQPQAPKDKTLIQGALRPPPPPPPPPPKKEVKPAGIPPPPPPKAPEKK